MTSRGSQQNPAHGVFRGPLRLVEAARKVAARLAWGYALVVFMRLLAVLWVVQGLNQWAAVLVPNGELFDSVSPAWAAAVIFFCVFDLVAAVGLWLASPWGGAIWLFVALAQIFVAIAIPGFFSMRWVGANLGLIGIYFFLTWQAAHSGPIESRAGDDASFG